MPRFNMPATFRLMAISILVITSFEARAVEAPISFGIVPQQAAAKLARLWSPLLAAVGRCSQTELQFRTAPSIPEFERRVDAGVYDLAYMNPYHYTVYSERVGYRALAKQSGKRIRGLIVVRSNSDINDLADLQGKDLSFPAPAAFAASVLPRAELRARGVSFTAKFVLSHDSVYQSVAKGFFLAGGGIERTLANIDATTRAQLRVLWRTRGYTPHAIATHPRIGTEVRNKLQECMGQLTESAEGRRMLKSIKFRGIEPASHEDWDDVRSLRLKQKFGVADPDRRL